MKEYSLVGRDSRKGSLSNGTINRRFGFGRDAGSFWKTGHLETWQGKEVTAGG